MSAALLYTHLAAESPWFLIGTALGCGGALSMGLFFSRGVSARLAWLMVAALIAAVQWA